MASFGQTWPTIAGVDPNKLPPEKAAALLEMFRERQAQQTVQGPHFQDPIAGYLDKSAQQVRRGAEALTGPSNTTAADPAWWNRKAQGAADVMAGSTPFLAPLAAVGVAEAPVGALLGLGGGIAAGEATKAAAKKAGVPEGRAALLSQLAGVAGGGIAAGTTAEDVAALGEAFDKFDFGSERGSISKAPRVENKIGDKVRGTMGGPKGKTYVPLPEDVDALAAKMKPDNPEAGKRAATAVLKWRNWEKPAIEKKFGSLVRSSPTDTKLERLQNVPERVQQRIQESQAFLAKPTDRWTPKDYGVFDRSLIKQAMNGFPDVEQTPFTRAQPMRASLSHVDEIYNDPVNRKMIKTQIARGLPLGGETFYPSLYPVKAEAIARNLRSPYFSQTGGDLFDHWIHSVAPGSARNSILNERAVGNLLRNMKARGIPLTEENVTAEMAAFKKRYGQGLPLMPVHAAGAARVLEQGLSPIHVLRNNLTDSYKIPTYSVQQTGNFAHSWTGDVHEATGETLGSRFHPYFTDQGGFGVNEYGRAEQYMRDIAKEMSLPTGTAQAGRWFGGGELTGLKSPRGDSLDMLEQQVAYTLHAQGKPATPQAIRDYTMKLIQEGGDLLPWAPKRPMPDYRQRK